ncbi:MAG: phosphoglucosamine mutase [Bacteroidales bacterium]|nr:phosphoglucosamine mutase [Bacteroidales bacterium]
MSLITSISGIRGTIGGLPGVSLSPLDIVRFTSAYAQLIKEQSKRERHTVVVGRDARLSGDMVRQLVCGTLQACGMEVIDLGLASTPTTEMAVLFTKASGGMVITASHNPRDWNALKMLDGSGEFLNAQQGEQILETIRNSSFTYVSVDQLGAYSTADFTDKHIEAVINHPLVNKEAIRKAGFSAAVDGINSVGGIIVPRLLESLGVVCHKIHCHPTGEFAHNPEPLPEHLKDLSAEVVTKKADLGISVDPDVDRLALVCEDGSMFGEEFTLVACADYVLGKHAASHPGKPLHTVSNLSSTRALKDVAGWHKGTYSASAVGEAHVVAEMKRTASLIGGEGNGGVILPSLHYGRDAVIGVALFLSLLAEKKTSVSKLRNTYPTYHLSKNRKALKEDTSLPVLFDRVQAAFPGANVDLRDGLRLDFEEERTWVSLRKSNTEPIMRIYSEAPLASEANQLAGKVMKLL